MSVSTPTTICTYAASASVTTSGAQTLTANAPVDSLLMVTMGGATASVTYGISDTQSHTWTPLTLWNQPTTTLMSVQVFYTKIQNQLVAGVDTITCTRSPTNGFAFMAEYVTGQHLTSPIGNGGTTPTNSQSTTVTTLSTASVDANAGDLTRAALVVTGNSINPTSTTLTVTNNIVNTVTNTRRIVTGHRLAATGETVTPDFSWTTANMCAMGSYVIAVASTAPAATTFIKTVTIG